MSITDKLLILILATNIFSTFFTAFMLGRFDTYINKISRKETK